MYNGFHVKYSLFLSSCKVLIIIVKVQQKGNFLNRLSKNLRISYFMKIHPLGGELIHMDRWADK